MFGAVDSTLDAVPGRRKRCNDGGQRLPGAAASRLRTPTKRAGEALRFIRLRRCHVCHASVTLGSKA
jgi:hypothetical protein